MSKKSGVTPTFSAPQRIYDSALYPGSYPYLLYGVSEMVYDNTTSTIYIASAVNNATTVANYVILKLRYDPTQIGTDNTKVLTQNSSTPFYQYGNDTRCISQMIIAR